VIYRFTYDGKLEKTLGQLGVRGRGPNTFDRPTDIAWLPDCTYFISDGYGGTRVAKFDRTDKFLLDWGKAPANPANPGPSEFNTPHSVAVSADRHPSSTAYPMCWQACNGRATASGIRRSVSWLRWGSARGLG
jgi:hypothetical protein